MKCFSKCLILLNAAVGFLTKVCVAINFKSYYQGESLYVLTGFVFPFLRSVIFPPSLAKMFDRHCCLLCALETRLGDSKWQGMHGDVVAKFAGMESVSIDSFVFLNICFT